ncbi:MAG: hypothetical protein LC796_01430 [Acidobacteria bacterium]|nr:hypothetical protein [Acidobacteriota bacterium]MCA1611104.1 hypothetical protein [Acidobacteriota bacterium]
MKKILCVLVSVLAALFSSGCTNKQGETESPVFITTDIQLQPGFVNVGTVAPVQIQTIRLQSHLKNPTATDPQHFSDVQIESYRVHFRRTDGGTLVPADKTFGAGVLVPTEGTSTLSNFPILASSDVQLSPFDQLLPFNGGIDRETRNNEIQMTFDLTFFGHTVSGHRVQSETASGILLFRFAGATPLSKSVR